MSANSTANLIGLLLVPAIILLLLAGLYLWVARWKRQIFIDLKDMRAGMREIEGEYIALTTRASEFSPADPEPYGSQAADLQTQIGKTQESILQYRASYGQLNQAAQADRAWNMRTLPQAPAKFYALRKDISRLKADAASIQSEISHGNELYASLRRRGLVTAGEVREAQQKLADANQTLQQLRTLNMQGDAFENANREKSLFTVALSSVPEDFLQSGEELPAGEADKDRVVQIHQMLAENRQPISTLLSRVKSWDTQIHEAANSLTQLRTGLDELARLLETLPFELIIDPLRERYQQLQDTLKELEGSLSNPVAENLPALNRDARRSARLAQDLLRQIDASHQAWKSLMHGIPQLQTELDTLKRDFQTLASAPRLPVDWDLSFPRLTALRKELKGIGSEKEPRTPEEVERDLSGLGFLRGRAIDLSQSQAAVSTRHTELMALLDRLNLEGTLTWIEDSINLARQAQRYSAENWPKKVSVNELVEELDNLQDEISHIRSEILTRPLKESTLDALFEQLSVLESRLLKIQGLDETVRRRFEEIRALEDETIDGLTAARAALLQIQRIARANEHLQTTALPGVERSLAELEVIAGDLENRAQGGLTKKNNALNTTLRTTESAANGWLSTLTRDTQARSDRLAERVEMLNGIAAIDEPVIQDTERFLARRQEHPTPRARKLAVPLTELPLQFKDKNDEWQGTVALLSALEEVEKPILDAAQSANEQREAARLALIQAKGMIPDQRSWPPTAQTLTTELNEYADVEDAWDALQKSPNRAIWLVSRLSDLAHRYAAITERARQASERAVGEAARVRDLERSLSESQQLWRVQMKASAANPYTQDAIQGMLAETSERIEIARQDFMHGSKQYPQIIQELILLARRLNSAQVPLDEEQSIDINGEVRVNYPPGTRQ